MPIRKFIGLLSTLGLATRFVNGQLEPDCNPLHADCPAKKAWPEENYYIDFTKETGPPKNWIIANDEVINFTPQGAEFTYAKRGDAPNMWTDFYMLGGRYDVELQIAPGQGIISSSVLWSDIQDEIDWEFSGNQHGEQPFPPPDGKWTVETNIFAQGKMWDGAATYQKDAHNPTTQFHTYSVEWDENHMNWYVDNQVVRSAQASNTPSGFIFPQSPMKLQLGVWGGGDPSNNYWTIQWAGGEIDMKSVPYTMYVRSVNITNKYPACQYKYQDRSGKITGIDKIHDGCSPSSASTSASTTLPEIIKDSPGAETLIPVKSMGIYPTSIVSEPAGTGNASSSSPSVSSPVSPMSDTITSQSISASSAASSELTPSAIAGSYPVASSYLSGSPVSNTTTSQPTPASSAASSELTPSTIVGGYPVASSSSTGGILSSLSSLFLGTSSGALYSGTSSMPGFNGTYPATLITASVSTSKGSGSSSIGVTTPAPSGTLSASSALSSSLMTGSSSLSSFASLSSTIFSNVSSETMPTTYTFSSEITTSFMSTVYSTNIITITSCAPTVKNCPVGKVTTEIVSMYTTFCPVTNTVIDGTTFSGQPSQVDSTTGSISSTSISSSPTPLHSQSPPSLVSSDSLTTNLVPSLGTSLSVVMSGIIYPNTTAPASGSFPTVTQSPTNSPASTPVELTTSTVYSTNIYTITSCAPTVTNCPARLGQVTTELVSLYTTICPVEQGVTTSLQESSDITIHTSASSVPSYSLTVPLNSPISSDIVLTTSTVYTSSVYTVSSCAPGAIECSSNIGSVTTELVPIYTTVCPVKDQSTTSSLLTSTAVSETSIESTPSFANGASSTLAELPSSSSLTASSPAPVYTTSTLYSTTVYTVMISDSVSSTYCDARTSNCVRSKFATVTTEIIAVSTTVCPVSDKTIPADVPSYTMTEIESTIEMSFSSTISRPLETPAPDVTTITSSVTHIETAHVTPSQGHQGEDGQCICDPTISTVYATVTVAETTITSTKTVEPPFPSTYGTGTGGVPLGTGQPTNTGAPKRRWFRRAQAGHGHGHH